jgi:hypothetical protein
MENIFCFRYFGNKTFEKTVKIAMNYVIIDMVNIFQV